VVLPSGSSQHSSSPSLEKTGSQEKQTGAEKSLFKMPVSFCCAKPSHNNRIEPLYVAASTALYVHAGMTVFVCESRMCLFE